MNIIIMKNLFRSVLLASVITLTGVGCLKDEGFEDQKYGTQIQEVKGVAFNQAAVSPVVLGITSQTTSQTVDGPVITLEQEGTAATDVTVNIQVNNTLVTDLKYTPLPPSVYTISTLTPVIPLGQKSTLIKITIPNSSTLDPTKTYGVGLTITSVSSGYTIAANSKDVVIAFTVKNKYDGKYRVTGTFVDLTNATFTSALPNDVELRTEGPNSVVVYRLINGAYSPGYLFLAAGAGTFYGSFGVRFIFDNNDNLIRVENFYGQPSPNNRFAFIDPTGSAEGKNKFFTADHSIKAKYTLNQPTEATVRSRFDELYTYLGPR